MWKFIVIDEKSTFVQCKIKDNISECIVFDLTETWCCKETLNDLIGRVKNLNKRIRVDEATIRKVLTEGQSEQANWKNVNDVENERILAIKYRVNSCPFNFEWHLKRQNETELKELLLLPIINCIGDLTQQKAELLDILRKKDAEILQYKTEFGTLRIKTVATQPFNAVEFKQKFSDANDVADSWSQIAQYWKPLTVNACELKNSTGITTTTTTTKTATKTIKTEVPSTENNKNSNSPKNVTNGAKELSSPRNRKRKVREAQIQRKMTTRKQKLEYENSQNLTEETIKNESDEDNSAQEHLQNNNEDNKKVSTTSKCINTNEEILQIKNRKAAEKCSSVDQLMQTLAALDDARTTAI